jgi:hypothetical protein
MARETTWRTLVRELTDAGYESVYLDRLRSRVDVAQAQASLEKEIIGEIAAALGRAESKLNAALLRLELAGRAIACAIDASERDACALAFERTRQEALTARWELAIHREAVGLLPTNELELLYPIPSRRSEGPTDDSA